MKIIRKICGKCPISVNLTLKQRLTKLIGFASDNVFTITNGRSINGVIRKVGNKAFSLRELDTNQLRIIPFKRLADFRFEITTGAVPLIKNVAVIHAIQASFLAFNVKKGKDYVEFVQVFVEHDQQTITIFNHIIPLSQIGSIECLRLKRR
ncbi:hypothetical protein [Paenibacillus qinlingensis]|uniref:hypothetical protein n=1 Tax=Paenibacillus qinlingensis TaxID=1837343 RepID=UPI001565ADB5|nr:hypothetical protein [Paenibacillus qinlingensis]NQX57966.1 hypothetical protein [Paenibacillus qinlingensis]